MFNPKSRLLLVSVVGGILPAKEAAEHQCSDLKLKSKVFDLLLRLLPYNIFRRIQTQGAEMEGHEQSADQKPNPAIAKSPRVAKTGNTRKKQGTTQASKPAVPVKTRSKVVQRPYPRVTFEEALHLATKIKELSWMNYIRLSGQKKQVYVVTALWQAVWLFVYAYNSRQLKKRAHPQYRFNLIDCLPAIC